MSLKKINPILQTIVISAVTSFLCSIGALLLYFRLFAPSGSAKALPKDPQFAKYEEIINDFMDTIRKGQIEAAYKQTAPSFQKISSIDDFNKLITGYQTAQSIPSSPCFLTEYCEPFPGTIKDLPDKYMIIQAKCEVTEAKEIKGFNIEFIDDEGKLKISYINVYKTPIIHKKEGQIK